RAVELQPAAEFQSNVLLTLQSREENAQFMLEEHRRWGERFAAPLARTTPHRNDRAPDRLLRIGYVSPDFRQHSVSAFMVPLLECHDRRRFHVTCYAASARFDDVTRRLQSMAGQWVNLFGQGDREAAERIEADGIDILVDLAGHTANHRLLVFARKPAPVQVSYLGYPDTTGMEAMDWKMTDGKADPAGAEAYYVEKLFRLPRTAWCFHPLAGSPPIELERGGRGIVFGSFNAMSKLNSQVLGAWAKILRGTPGSRLIIKNRATGAVSVRDELLGKFAGFGVGSDRVEILAPTGSPEEHMRSYRQVDIALDTYPYHGTTTTCEALWMGVPVITRAGLRHVGRVGLSLLESIDLEELVATDEGSYVRLAVELAGDKCHLMELRSTLRERMKESPLMDGADFARQIEVAFGRMWREWVLR
ncbi:MAG TPA: hypothetical protein VMD30_12985, partial [Tepidisphaeraceae bacterium]|nr:hypothetical protein [Tepidisphaeraceae bacterium]